MSFEVKHHSKDSQFVADVPGGQAQLRYRQTDDKTMDIYSTYVPTEARGMKVAELLLHEALSFAEKENLKIIPSCSYVAAWFQRHADKKSLLKT